MTRATRRALVLHLLREAGDRGVTTSEFLQANCGGRFGGRLFELRQEGHLIETERLTEENFRYTLTRDAERDNTPAGTGGGAGDGVVSLGADADPAAPMGEAEPPDEPTAPPSGSHTGADAPASPTLFDAAGLESEPGIYDYDPEDQAA